MSKKNSIDYEKNRKAFTEQKNTHKKDILIDEVEGTFRDAMNLRGNDEKESEVRFVTSSEGYNVRELPSTSSTEEYLCCRMITDSTSDVEICRMSNENFSREILQDTDRQINIDRLEMLRKTNKQAYFDYARDQVIVCWKGIIGLEIHHSLFTTRLKIRMGLILNSVEKEHAKKADYMRWVRKEFGSKHLRYFQQAKDLAWMGDFAINRAAIGGNRLLEFSRFIKEIGATPEQTLTKYPFADTTEDEEGAGFSRHIDSVLTLHRLERVGVDFATFEQASVIVSFNQGSLQVGSAQKISTWLAERQDKAQAFDDLVLNGLVYPGSDEPPQQQRKSINKIIADLLHYSSSVPIDPNWVQQHGGHLESVDIINAYKFIISLAGALSVNLTAIEANPTGEI